MMNRLVTVVGVMLLLVGSPASAAEAVIEDGAGDAYGPEIHGLYPPAIQPPSPFSDPRGDILEARFTSGVAKKQTRSYSVSLTLAGSPDASFLYSVAGEFGADCHLYHLLNPTGDYARANAFCPQADGTQEFIGTLWAGKTSIAGGVMTATWTYRLNQLPAALAADRELGPLVAFTCSPAGRTSRGCEGALDVGNAPAGLTFTI